MPIFSLMCSFYKCLANKSTLYVNYIIPWSIPFIYLSPYLQCFDIKEKIVVILYGQIDQFFFFKKADFFFINMTKKQPFPTPKS